MLVAFLGIIYVCSLFLSAAFLALLVQLTVDIIGALRTAYFRYISQFRDHFWASWMCAAFLSIIGTCHIYFNFFDIIRCMQNCLGIIGHCSIFGHYRCIQHVLGLFLGIIFGIMDACSIFWHHRHMPCFFGNIRCMQNCSNFGHYRCIKHISRDNFWASWMHAAFCDRTLQQFWASWAHEAFLVIISF